MVVKKSVHFNKNVIEYITYSYKQYDRSYEYNVKTKDDMKNIYITLDLYKLFDMPVHINSNQNTLYHLKNFFSYTPE